MHTFTHFSCQRPLKYQVDVWFLSHGQVNCFLVLVIPAVVLKDYEPEILYIPAELFNKCLKKSCFPDSWKVSSLAPVFKNFGERSTVKYYCPVSLLSLVTKVFEELVNNRIVYHLFFNWDSLHGRLNSHYKAWSYKKKKHK